VRIVAEFPDRVPMVLTDLSEDDPPRKSSRTTYRRDLGTANWSSTGIASVGSFIGGILEY